VPFYYSDGKDDSCFGNRIRSDVELQDPPVIVVEDQPFARVTFNTTTEHYLAEIAQTICHSAVGEFSLGPMFKVGSPTTVRLEER